MNTKLLLSSLICSLCLTITAHANTKTPTAKVDTQAQKYQQVCKAKKQGDTVSFAYKGVIFNGVCQTNAQGKLVFEPPMPAANTSPETQSRLSETQSAPRPMNTPIIQTAPVSPMTDDPEQTTP